MKCYLTNGSDKMIEKKKDRGHFIMDVLNMIQEYGFTIKEAHELLSQCNEFLYDAVFSGLPNSHEFIKAINNGQRLETYSEEHFNPVRNRIKNMVSLVGGLD